MEELLKYKDNIESYEFKKALYDFYEKKHFERDDLKKVSYNLNIKVRDLEAILSSYASEYMNMSRDEFSNFRQKKRYTYKETILSKENPILIKFGIKTNCLYTNEDERDFMIKYVYEFLSNYDFSTDALKEISNYLGIKYNVLTNIIVDSISLLKLENEKEIVDKLINTKNRIKASISKGNTKTKGYYDLLVKCNSNDEAISALDKNITDFNRFKTGFRLYEEFYNAEEISKINKYFDIYTDIMKERSLDNKNKRVIHNKEEKIDILKSLIDEYIETDSLSFELLCHKKGYDDVWVKRNLLLLQKSDIDTYNKLINRKKDIYKRKIDMEKDILKYIADHVGKKIEEDGKERNFDFLDVLSMVHLPISEIVNLASRVLPRSSYYRIKGYVGKYRRYDCDDPKVIEEIFQERRIIGTKLDSDGKLIEGSGREITESEKKNIINYLESNNLPVNRVTYNIAFRRYINGFITFNSKVYKYEPNSID